MSPWLLRRLASLPLLLLVVTSLVFALVEVVPGDPIDFMIGENAALDRKQELRAAYHLDDPVHVRYARFYGELGRGELRSLHTREPVAEILAARMPFTLLLAAVALLVSAGVALPLGTLSAWKPDGWLDALARTASLVGISIPNFWLGPLLIILFAIHLGWLPVAGADRPASVVLPAMTLGLGMASILTRITRAAVLDALSSDHVRTARAKGASELRVVLAHGLRAAMVPVLTILGLQFGALLTGAIITEEVFGWPGLGREIVTAIRSRDLPVIQGCVLVISVTWLLVNTGTDLLYRRFDPRVELR